MAKNYSVYRIRFDDDTEYFGNTSQDLARRIEQHTTASHSKGVAERMDAGMDFEVSLMAQGLPKSEALELERGYIRTSKNSLNGLVGRPTKNRSQITLWMGDKTRKKLGQVKRRLEQDAGKDITRPDALEAVIDAGHQAIMDGSVKRATPEQAERMRERERLEAQRIAREKDRK